jgi:hypothetical protein
MAITTSTEVELNVTLVYSNFSITTGITVPLDCINENLDWGDIGIDGDTLERIITEIAGTDPAELEFWCGDLQDVIVAPRLDF